MTMKQTVMGVALAAATTLLAAGSAQAHFQLLYTPEVNLEKAGKLPVKMIFWHPMENGHAMDMGQPEQFALFFKGRRPT